jgi:hypothetical protein
MMSRGSLEDRLAIRELIETFAVGTMRIDPDLWGSTWAEEGVWGLPSLPEPAKGKTNIVATFKEKLAYVRFISVAAFPSDLVIEGDRARSTTYSQELIFPKTGGSRTVAGYFDDEFVKRDGKWFFLSRIFNVLGADPAS